MQTCPLDQKCPVIMCVCPRKFPLQWAFLCGQTGQTTTHAYTQNKQISVYLQFIIGYPPLWLKDIHEAQTDQKNWNWHTRFEKNKLLLFLGIFKSIDAHWFVLWIFVLYVPWRHTQKRNSAFILKVTFEIPFEIFGFLSPIKQQQSRTD